MREHGVETIESILPSWAGFTYAVGFDGEGEGGEGEGDGGAGEGGEGEGEGEGSSGGGEGDDPTVGLKKALAAERLKSKRLERDLAAAKKAPGKGQGSTATEDEGEGQGSAAKVDPVMTSKLERLTIGFRETALRSTIGELAKDFRDVGDVLANIDTSLINYEQDDDDPTIVVWDEAELKTAIKDLAKRKPYLLKQASGEGDQGAGGRRNTRPTGGQFGRVGAGAQRTTAAQQTEALARRIPALRTAVRGGGTTNGT